MTRLKGSHVTIESLDTVYDQVVSRSFAYGMGGLTKDQSIVFPSQMLRDVIVEALYELLLTGASYPESGIFTLFSADVSYGKNLKEILRLFEVEFNLKFMIEEERTPDLPTLAHLTLISRVDKNLLRKRAMKENFYIYYLTTSQKIMPVEMIAEISYQKGFDGFYLLKNESIEKGLRFLFDDTSFFLIPEKKQKVSFKKEISLGKGLLAISPYRLKEEDTELLVTKLGIVFKKGIV